eukprot:1158199-Pelagomonas_calceolata.AAC.5
MSACMLQKTVSKAGTATVEHDKGDAACIAVVLVGQCKSVLSACLREAGGMTVPWRWLVQAAAISACVCLSQLVCI